VSSLGVRKTTPPDEEFKIIVFSSSFVLHYINEVLFTHYPEKWIVSVRVKTEDPVQPLLYL
jgi:hypothetical protein